MVLVVISFHASCSVNADASTTVNDCYVTCLRSDRELVLSEQG